MLNRESETGKEGLGQLERREKSRLHEEVEAGEWQGLINFPEYRARSREGRIITVYNAIGNRIKQLEGFFYKVVVAKPAKGQQLLDGKIKPLRFYQSYLEECITLKGGEEQNPMPASLKRVIDPQSNSEKERTKSSNNIENERRAA